MAGNTGGNYIVKFHEKITGFLVSGIKSCVLTVYTVSPPHDELPFSEAYTARLSMHVVYSLQRMSWSAHHAFTGACCPVLGHARWFLSMTPQPYNTRLFQSRLAPDSLVYFLSLYTLRMLEEFYMYCRPDYNSPLQTTGHTLSERDMPIIVT